MPRQIVTPQSGIGHAGAGAVTSRGGQRMSGTSSLGACPFAGASVIDLRFQNFRISARSSPKFNPARRGSAPPALPPKPCCAHQRLCNLPGAASKLCRHGNMASAIHEEALNAPREPAANSFRLINTHVHSRGPRRKKNITAMPR